MGEIGQVIARDTNIVTVQLVRTEACASCRVCTMGMKKEEMLLRAQNECGANIGDSVEIELREGVFFHAVAIMYLLPFSLLLIGFVAGHFIGGVFLAGTPHSLTSFASGILLMLLGYLFIKKNEPRYKKGHFTPSAVRIAAQKNE